MLQFNATFIVAIISFVLFIIIMNLIFYKPILSIIEERKKYIQDNYDASENLKKDANLIVETKNKRISNMEKLAKQIIFDKTNKSNNEAQSIVKNAKIDAAQKIETEKEAILAMEKSSDIGKVVSEVSDNIARKLLGDI